MPDKTGYTSINLKSLSWLDIRLPVVGFVRDIATGLLNLLDIVAYMVPISREDSLLHYRVQQISETGAILGHPSLYAAMHMKAATL